MSINSRGNKRLMKKYLGIAIVVFLVFTIYFNIQISKENPNEFGAKSFRVEPGQGVEEIAANLVEQGFLARPFWFKVYVAASGNKARFIDGEYDLKTNLSIKDLVLALTNQKNSNKETEITLLEGWTAGQMDEYLAGKGLIKAGEMVDYSQNFDEKSFLFLIDRPKQASLDGYLYPDTYRIYQAAGIGSIVKKMLDNFDQKLTPELRAEIKKQKKTIFEVVVLASIVEREMFGYENRRVVADIFQKRLAAGMALQSDATINFITKKGIAAPGLDDLRIDNAYNTYKYRGLPPGPICNPSIEAIRAVIYPANTGYWYFLNAPSGEIIFSQTHDGHVLNKQKYLK